MPDDPTPADFRPTAAWENLRLRAQLLRRVRQFFDAREFLEVETPILSADTAIDRHIDPVPVTLEDSALPPGIPGRLWLQTSPEFGMKRLLAAGAKAIYQVTRAFRLGERGPLHNPEFTMVEWYRVGDGMEDGMRLLGEVAECLLGRGAAETISYAEAFAWHVGLDPHSASGAELASRAQALKISVPASLGVEDRDAWLDLLVSERVQPNLGHGRPVILYDYPASQAALARVRPGRPPVAERFELYVDGIELANGYHELVDAAVLRERNARNNALREADGKPRLPEESRLLAAMEAGLPAATGVALGFDRVVMLAAGASDIRQVLAFPMERA
jgi:lysyl-tRNA synthetase class 2